MISLSKNSWNRLLGPQNLVLCLCLLETAMATITTAPAAPANQGLDSNGVESLIAELSSLPTLAAFRLFLQRAQALITGLVYVSILVLPRKAHSANEDDGKSSTKNRKGGIGGGSTSMNLNSSKAKKGGNTAAPKSPLRSRNGGSGGSVAAAAASVGEIGHHPVPLGTTADGSNLEAWQQVNSALENQAACGLDWSNSCVYELKDKLTNQNNASCVGKSSGRGGVLLLASEPEYRLPATAAFQAATKSVDGIICNEYDTRKGPHYADWQQLATIHNAQSFASLPMYISTSMASSNNAGDAAAATDGGGGAGGAAFSTTNNDQVLVGVLNLASTDPHAFESSRLVWLLAMALAPLAAQLNYAEPALRFENFIGRVMPLLLKENYLKTTERKKENLGGSSQGALTLGTNTSTKQKQLQPMQSPHPLKLISNSDVVVLNPQNFFSTNGSLKFREEARLQGKRESSHTETLEFLLSLASMSIVYLAFWHATHIHISNSSSVESGAGRDSGCLSILKFIAGADILRLAMKWIWYNVILPSQRQKKEFSNNPSTTFESSALVNALKALNILVTSAVLGILSGLHRLFFLPMAHCWMVWFVVNKALGGFYLNSWQLAGPMLGFCWQIKTMMQDILKSSSFSSFAAAAYDKNQIGSKVDNKLHKERQIYIETVLLAAASAERVCTAGFGLEVTSYECLAVVTGVQFALKQLVPPAIGILVILLRGRKLWNTKKQDE